MGSIKGNVFRFLYIMMIYVREFYDFFLLGLVGGIRE